MTAATENERSNNKVIYFIDLIVHKTYDVNGLDASGKYQNLHVHERFLYILLLNFKSIYLNYSIF